MLAFQHLQRKHVCTGSRGYAKKHRVVMQRTVYGGGEQAERRNIS